MRAGLIAVLVFATLTTPAHAEIPDALRGLHAPVERADARDAGDSPIDVASAAFGQVGTRLTLRVRMHEVWRPGDLRGQARSVCVDVTRGAQARRICISPQLGVTAGGLAAGGRLRLIRSVFTRPDRRTVAATFTPFDAGLGFGAVRWTLSSRWRDDAACRDDCVDRMPERGVFRETIATLGQPRCFGAAARDPRRPCRNPALDRLAYPRPSDALLVPDAPCRARPPRGPAVLTQCHFGVLDGTQRATFALIGDSHARTWRSPLEVVAQALRWRGISITRPGCPFSTEILSSPDLGPADCRQLHREIVTWLRRHPYVHTIFVSHYSALGFSPGGFAAMWGSLPGSVRRIYVLRDNPVAPPGAARCVEAALRAGRRPAPACTSSRRAVLRPDPQVRAAASDRRARVIDLTRFFCGPSRCHSVVGGAYVYKDDNHMGAYFATSLGPYVTDRLRRERPRRDE